MPRLGSLLVCEKIIQDQLGKPTLIALFQKMSAVVPEGQEMPKDAIAGTAWSAFSEWFFTEDELDKKFEQVLEVVMPDGSPSPIRGRLPLTQLGKDGLGSRCYVNMIGVPVSKVGFLSVNVWLVSNSERVTDVFSYLIQIEHLKEPPVPNDGGTIIQTFAPAPKE